MIFPKTASFVARALADYTEFARDFLVLEVRDAGGYAHEFGPPNPELTIVLWPEAGGWALAGWRDFMLAPHMRDETFVQRFASFEEGAAAFRENLSGEEWPLASTVELPGSAPAAAAA